jgi:hypothetical protein
LSVLGGGNVVTWSTNGRLKAKLGGSRLNKLNQDIAIGRMINNIGAATTNKISIARPSYIDNMIGYTSTLTVAVVILLPVQEGEAMET